MKPDKVNMTFSVQHFIAVRHSILELKSAVDFLLQNKGFGEEVFSHRVHAPQTGPVSMFYDSYFDAGLDRLVQTSRNVYGICVAGDFANDLEATSSEWLGPVFVPSLLGRFGFQSKAHKFRALNNILPAFKSAAPWAKDTSLQKTKALDLKRTKVGRIVVLLSSGPAPWYNSDTKTTPQTTSAYLFWLDARTN